MSINDYLEELGSTHKELADKLGCTIQYISMLRAGKRKPSWQFAVKLERVTCGKVSRENWFPSGQVVQDE